MTSSHRPYLAALLATSLAGCISIGTYEKQMQKLRQSQVDSKRLEETIARLEKENADLRRQAEVTTTEQKDLTEKISEVRSTYDDLIQRLQDDISSGAVEIEKKGDDVTVTLGNQVLFQSGRADLQPKGMKILAQVASVLMNVGEREIRVEGHTDNIPISGALKARYPSNWELSSSRASSVARFLQEKGVNAERMIAVGAAEFRPVADNKTVEGRKQNRRVEIFITRAAARKP
jgi:chemotaxis protein MotB